MLTTCPVCATNFPTVQRLCTHIRSYHNGQMGNIVCSINNCQRTFRNVHTWKSHIRRTPDHREAVNMDRPQNVPVNQNMDGVDAPILDDNMSDVSDIVDNRQVEELPTAHNMLEGYRMSSQRAFFNFAVKIREKHMLPVSVTHSILDEVQGLLEFQQTSVGDIVKRQLATNPTASCADFIFEDEDMHSVICQASKSDGAIASLLYQNYPFVAPVEQELGHTANKKHIAHIIPLKQLLSKILTNDDIVVAITSNLALKRHHDSKNIAAPKLYDVKYDLAETNQVVDLPLIFYMDEFEPCNPIGSRRKIHKLTAIYFTIASLPPSVRSQVSSIFLYGLSYYSHIMKYRYEKLLQPLCEDLISMAQTDLVVKTRKGLEITYKVKMLFVSADNLSAHDLLGLQKNFTHGKFSRYCLTEYDNINGTSDFIKCELRTAAHHQQQIDLLDTNPEVVRHASGIVGKCVFSEIPGLDVTQLCPPDVMHDFMEGVVPVLICLSLLDIISNTHGLNIDKLNDVMSSFKYGSSDVKNRYGSTLNMAQLRSFSIPGTASEKLCLLRMLPLMLSAYTLPAHERGTPQPKGLDILLICLDIADVIMAHVIRPLWLSDLRNLIIELHDLVNELNPRAVKPKLHFLVHYPHLILRYGPPRHYFTMRFESMHQYFKSLVGKTRNFINLTLTLSTRFQKRLAYDLNQDQYYFMDQVSSGVKKTLSSLSEPTKDLLKTLYPDLEDDEEVFQTSNLKQNGVRYKQNDVLVWRLVDGELEIPEFVQIKNAVQIRAKWLLLVKCYRTKSFIDVLHAYEVSEVHNGLRLMEPGAEIDFSSLSTYSVNDLLLVPIKYKLTSNVSYINYLPICISYLQDHECICRVKCRKDCYESYKSFLLWRTS